MQIEFDQKFKINLQIILERIAKDKLSASKKFRKDLFELIKKIPNFPYKYRKSYYFDNENIRDMIFKKYTITYEIKSENNLIIVLNIFNQNKPPLG